MSKSYDVPTVIVTVEGGVVQHVEVPEGIVVLVRDYDVDGSDPREQTDEQGDKFLESSWEING